MMSNIIINILCFQFWVTRLWLIVDGMTFFECFAKTYASFFGILHLYLCNGLPWCFICSSYNDVCLAFLTLYSTAWGVGVWYQMLRAYLVISILVYQQIWTYQYFWTECSTWDSSKCLTKPCYIWYIIHYFKFHNMLCLFLYYLQ